MVAIFTGLGAGFGRGSGSLLGAAGLLGGSTLGRGGEGVFLNASTGNLILTHQDEFLVGRGPDVAISRTYNSLGAPDDNGDYWRQSTDRRVYGLTGAVNTAGSSIHRISADGTDILYTWNTDHYEATEGAGTWAELVWSGADSSWTWRDPDSGITEKYEAAGADAWRVKRQTDTDGNYLDFTYSAAGKLERVTTANGEYTEYHWSAAGTHIDYVRTGYVDGGQNKTLTRTYYDYDGQDRLVTVRTDLSPNDNDPNSGGVYSTSYTYDGSSRRITAIDQTDGSRLVIQYDGAGRVTSLTQTVAGAEVRTTTIGYIDAYTRTVTDPRGLVTTLTYDDWNRLTYVTAPPAVTGAAAQVVHFEYDANAGGKIGKLNKVTDPTGAATSYVNDAKGRVTRITDALGRIADRAYDSDGNLSLETRTGSSASTGSGSLYTRFVYDSERHLRFAISAEGTVTEYEYSTDGQLRYTYAYTQQTYSIGASIPTHTDMVNWRTGIADKSTVKVSEIRYNARGAVIETLASSSTTSGGAASAAGGQTDTFFTYDQYGQLLNRHTVGQGTETFVYDGMGRLTSSVNLASGLTTILFEDAQTRTTITTSLGYTTVSVYNKAGDLLSSTDSGAEVNGGTQYAFADKNGQVRHTVDASGKHSYFLYDRVGRKIADIAQSGEISEYRYDQAGRLVAIVHYGTALSAGQVNQFNDANSEIDIASLRPAASALDIWQWSIFDAAGQVVETIAGDGSVTAYAYDSAGRLIKTTQYVNRLASVASFKTTAPTTPTLPGADLKDRVSRTFYDRDGQAVGSLDSEGYLSRVDYDASGQKVREQRFANATANDANLRATGTFDQLQASITLDAAHDGSSRYIYDNQGLLRWTVDGLNRVSEVVYTEGSGTQTTGQVRKTITYAGTIGALGSYTAATLASAVAPLAGNAANRISYAVYNDKGQVSYSVDTTGSVTAFVYDGEGRVTKAIQFAVLLSGVDLNSPNWKAGFDAWAASNGANARVSRTYYSAHGEVIGTVDAEGYVTLSDYDQEGRITTQRRYAGAIGVDDSTTIAAIRAANKGAMRSETYEYDPLGRMYRSTDAAGVVHLTIFYANGVKQQDVAASGVSAESRTYYEYDTAGRLLRTTSAYGRTEASWESYTYDGLGNVATKTDANGGVTTFTYDRVGRVLTQTNALGGVTQFQYNAFGDATRTTDARGAISQVELDKAGQVTRQTDALNRATLFEYDAFGEVLKVTNALGATSYSYYDRAGRVIATVDAEQYVTETNYTVFGEVQTVVRRYERASSFGIGALPSYNGNALDAGTTFHYDRLGRVVDTTDALLKTEYYTLNGFGERIDVTSKLGGHTLNEYDARGQLITETFVGVNVYDSSGNVIATSIVNRYEYDARGNRTKMIEASGRPEQRTTTYEYDALGRLTRKIGDAFQASSTSDGGTALSTPIDQYFYDRAGNVIETRNAAGARTVTWYDALNRITFSLSATGFTTDNPPKQQGVLTQNIYDPNGNATETRVYETLVTLPDAVGGSLPSLPASYRRTIYAFDLLNRVVETRIPAVLTAAYAGGSLGFANQDLVTTVEYDAVGNVISSTDANQQKAFSYYDKLGRKVSQVDQEGYRIDFVYNTDGNVMTETRYANRVSGTPTTAAPPAVTADAARDRITLFEYDKRGQRTVEKRLNVLVFNLNSGDNISTTSTITYTYNALGQVLTKTEASGDSITYTYDVGGRMVSEARDAIADFTSPGNTVTPTTFYFYNGLNDLSRAVQAGGGGADAHITTYEYGAGGRRVSMTDAENSQHTYVYDVMGRLQREVYNQGGTTGPMTSALGYDYDLAGRVTRQGILALNGGGQWDRTGLDYAQTVYNAYGEVSGQGVNGRINQTSDYDAAGRVWRTTTGDGTWKYFLYDSAGNQTVTIASAGDNIANKTLGEVLNKWSTTNWAVVGSGYAAGVNATITIYSKRGEAIEVIEPHRELATGQARVTLSTKRSYTAFGEVAAEINAANATIDYKYNTMGRLIETMSPEVSVTGENGGSTPSRPVDKKYYDASGRLVATRDANGNLTTMTLLKGTGYGGTEALVVDVRTTIDGATVHTDYDIHGDARRIVDQIGRSTIQTFDKMGRLIRMQKPDGFVEHYEYDTLGQRTKRWTDATGIYDTEITIYDRQGRITSQRSIGGDTTTYAYAWDGNITTSGIGAFGGWTKITTFANSKYSTDVTDQFGRDVSKLDLSQHSSTFIYDAAGRMVQRTGGEPVSYTFYNTGRVSAVFNVNGNIQSNDWTRERTSYEYDAVGNVRREVTAVDSSHTAWTPESWEDHWIDYDVDHLSYETVWVQVGTQHHNDFTGGAGSYYQITSYTPTTVLDHYDYQTVLDHYDTIHQFLGGPGNYYQITSYTSTQVFDHNNVSYVLDHYDTQTVLDHYETQTVLDHYNTQYVLDHYDTSYVIDHYDTSYVIDHYDTSYVLDHYDTHNEWQSNVAHWVEGWTTDPYGKPIYAGYYEYYDDWVAVSTPVYVPVYTPVYTTVYTPVYAPVYTPIYVPVQVPVYTQIQVPIYTQVQVPVYNTVYTPVYNTVTTPNFTQVNPNVYSAGYTTLYRLEQISHEVWETEWDPVSGKNIPRMHYEYTSEYVEVAGPYYNTYQQPVYRTDQTPVYRTDQVPNYQAIDPINNYLPNISTMYRLQGGVYVQVQGPYYNSYDTPILEQQTHEIHTIEHVHQYDPIYHAPQPYVQTSYTAVTDSTAIYDALGRMTSWTTANTATTPGASMSWQYDANGNIRHTHTDFYLLDGQGNTYTGSQINQDFWYRYDAHNRVITSKGKLIEGAIRRDIGGSDIYYDLAGQRVQLLSDSLGTDTQLISPDYSATGGPGPVYMTTDLHIVHREDYGYDSAGRVNAVWVNDGSMEVSAYDPNFIPTQGALRAVFEYDAYGRQINQLEFRATPVPGTTNQMIAYQHQSWYNAKGQLDHDFTVVVRPDTAGLWHAENSEGKYTYGEGEAYALGSVVAVETTSWQNNFTSSALRQLQLNKYEWWDGAVLKETTTEKGLTTQQQAQQKILQFLLNGILAPPGAPVHRSVYTYATYGGASRLRQVSIDDDRDRTVSYQTDLSGTITRRDEQDGFGANIDPHEVWHRFAGRQIGYVGNNGGYETDYATSIDAREAQPGPSTGPGAAMRTGAWGSALDFDQGPQGINSMYQGSSTGAYTVRGGDTLSSIAASMWGDASLWWKLAEANGLSGNASLNAGQQLVIPAGVMRSTYNAATFTPYDPQAAIGDTSPGAVTPAPPKKNKCGALGQIVLIVIAAVVTFYTAGALSGVMGPVLAGAVGGAAGSVASQAVGVATGIQDKFSWNAVGMAALGGAVGGALGPAKSLEWYQAVGRGVAQSAITQGIGVATGMQKKFSWAGVAAAGVGAGIANYVAGTAPGAARYNGDQFVTKATWYNAGFSSGASAIAEAATQSLIDGSDFGDNIMAALPNVIGGVVGQALTGEVSLGRDKPKPAPALPVAPPDPRRVASEGPGNKVIAPQSDQMTPQEDLSGPHAPDEPQQVPQPPAAPPVAELDPAVKEYFERKHYGPEFLETLKTLDDPGFAQSLMEVDKDLHLGWIKRQITPPAGKSVYEMDGLSLNLEDFQTALDMGLLKNLTAIPPVQIQNDKQANAAGNDVQKNAAQKQAAAAKTKQTLPDVEAVDLDLRQFVVAIAKETDQAKTGMIVVGPDGKKILGVDHKPINPEKFEKFISFSRNKYGEIIVTKIGLVDSQGGSFSVPKDSIAVAHIHWSLSASDGLNPKPFGADNSSIVYGNRPMFVIGDNGKSIFEVGRQKEKYVQRRINTDGSASGWQAFKPK